MSLTRDQIIGILLDNLKEGIWILAILYKEAETGPIPKEKLKLKVNEHYKQQNEGAELFTSRHILDVLCARLEGAGLAEVLTDKTRARRYSITPLGKQIVDEYIKRSKGDN